MSNFGTGGLSAAILEGNCAEAVAQAKQLTDRGVSPQHIVIHGIEKAMSDLDEKCTLEHFNLLEIMLAGRAVTEVMKFLYPAGPAVSDSKATVVLAALEGDVHDLGKNILKTVLISSGYRVVDCGKDVPLREFIQVAEKEAPLAVAISGLITPIIPLVRQVKDQLASRNLGRIRVLAGGAALKQSSSTRLNVDFVAESAFDAIHYLDEIAGGKR